MKMKIMAAQKSIEGPCDLSPHVVLLGAGASRAAFPNGDATGQRIPLMDDLVDVVGLQSSIDQAGFQISRESNFEVIYGQLAPDPGHTRTVKEIERRIDG